MINENKLIPDKNKAQFGDYPEAAVKAAKLALEYKDKYGDKIKAGTPVGWKRAKQLANREKLSFDVVTRMYRFKRHESNSKIDPKYKDKPYLDRGFVSWNLWGGDAGVQWAEKVYNKHKNFFK